MTVYYCVESHFNKNWTITAEIVEEKEFNGSRRPSSTCEITPTCDTYHTWFASSEKAAEYIKGCEKGSAKQDSPAKRKKRKTKK